MSLFPSLIASDLDGTLIAKKAPDGPITKRTKAVLKRFKEQGGVFVTSSGRPWMAMGEVAPQLEGIAEFYFCYDGNVCISTREGTPRVVPEFSNLMPVTNIARIAARVRKADPGITVALATFESGEVVIGSKQDYFQFMRGALVNYHTPEELENFFGAERFAATTEVADVEEWLRTTDLSSMNICDTYMMKPGVDAKELQAIITSVCQDDMDANALFLAAGALKFKPKAGPKAGEAGEAGAASASASASASAFEPITRALHFKPIGKAAMAMEMEMEMESTDTESTKSTKRSNSISQAAGDFTGNVNWGKAIGLQLLAKARGIPTSEVMVFGDDLNDEGMLRWAGQGVCPRNAEASMKAICDVVLEQTNEEGAVASHIEQLMAERGRTLGTEEYLKKCVAPVVQPLLRKAANATAAERPQTEVEVARFLLEALRVSSSPD